MSPRGRRAIIAASLLLLAAVLVTAGLLLRPAEPESTQATTRFLCPMHPEVVQDRPGSCPICGMDLVPAAADEATTTRGELYVCPMHPEVVRDHPGSCPICGMDLVRASADVEAASSTGSAATPAEHAAHEARPLPEGRAQVRLGGAAARRIGARSLPVRHERFEREIRATGTVTADETRLRQIHAKTAGWVERLWADAEGEIVRHGEPLLELYSPELLAAQEEYLVALRSAEELGASTVPSVAASARGLLDAARARLRLLDLRDEDIAALERERRARRTVVVTSPFTATVLRRAIAQGARIEPGTLLLELADLSRVWVQAAVFESELPYVRPGQAATVHLPYVPDRAFAGRVGLVYPTLDPATRTARVRVELPNPAGELRPDMYADVLLTADLGERLAVPASAVMETGLRSLVFVDGGDGLFTPREVEVGVRLPERVEVVAGLAAGERVLAQGNFFVDSESKLRAALEAAGHAH